MWRGRFATHRDMWQGRFLKSSKDFGTPPHPEPQQGQENECMYLLQHARVEHDVIRHTDNILSSK